jgi:hypothetical protein
VILETAAFGYLRLRTEVGGLAQIPVSITARNDRFVEIVPGSQETIQQAMSGSPLYVSGEMIGILLSLSQSGKGRVFRADALEGLLQSFINERQRAVSRSPPTALGAEASQFRIAQLRSKPHTLYSYEDVAKALKKSKLDFFEAALHPNGRGIQNSYEKLTVPHATPGGLSLRDTNEKGGAAFVLSVGTGPARNAGIMPGDVITEFDGKRVISGVQLAKLFREGKVGGVIAIRLFREDTARTLRLILEQGVDSVVVDYSTGLMWSMPSWSAKDPGSVSYWKALRFVKSLNEIGFAGHRDWRLPTIEEALSIVEPIPAEKSELYVSDEFLGGSFVRALWTSDECRGHRDFGWTINLEKGRTEEDLRESPRSVLAVRG